MAVLFIIREEGCSSPVIWKNQISEGDKIMNISLICFTRAGFETMKRINNALSGASEAFTNASCPEQYDKSAEAEDRPCSGTLWYKSLLDRRAVRTAARGGGCRSALSGGAGGRTFGVDEGGFSAGRCSYFCGCLRDAVRSIAPYVRDKFQDLRWSVWMRRDSL